MPSRIAFVSFEPNEGRIATYPPLHLCALATMLENAGHEARIFDYHGAFSKMDGFFSEIRDYHPTVIGMACFTPYIAVFHRVSSALRRAVPGAAMVIGGYHPTVLPEWSLERMPQFDYAMQGECDHAILEFVEMIEGKRGPAGVKGLVYRDGGGIRSNERDFVPDLNALPLTRRNFLDRYYSAGFYSYLTEPRGVDIMITSRGCPFSCSFCFKVERKYRFRSTESVMAEFDMLRSRNVRSVHIMDDAFTANRKRCVEVARALIAGKYRFRLKLRSRVNVVDLELLKLLKACGVRQIVYGIESGSQAVLDSMDKHTTVELNERAIRLTNEAGIFCTGDIMIGMPGETPDTLQQTISFLRRNRVIVGSVPYLYPLPGTRVFEDAKRSGRLRGDWDTEGTVPWVKLDWTNSIADLERAQVTVENAVRNDPRKVLYFLRHNARVLTSASSMAFLAQVARRWVAN